MTTFLAATWAARGPLIFLGVLVWSACYMVNGFRGINADLDTAADMGRAEVDHFDAWAAGEGAEA